MPMTLRVEGRSPLSGVYKPSGNANAAQALRHGTSVTEAPVTLRNMPRTLSLEAMSSKLRRSQAHLSLGKTMLCICTAPRSHGAFSRKPIPMPRSAPLVRRPDVDPPPACSS